MLSISFMRELSQPSNGMGFGAENESLLYRMSLDVVLYGIMGTLIGLGFWGVETWRRRRDGATGKRRNPSSS